jgi:hypothetical protein
VTSEDGKKLPVMVRINSEIDARLRKEAAVLGVTRSAAAAMLLAVGLRVMERITTTSKEDWERLNAAINREFEQ